jgi:hypothetical protein
MCSSGCPRRLDDQSYDTVSAAPIDQSVPTARHCHPRSRRSHEVGNARLHGCCGKLVPRRHGLNRAGLDELSDEQPLCSGAGHDNSRNPKARRLDHHRSATNHGKVGTTEQGRGVGNANM